MKISIVSDLHIEFGLNPYVNLPGGDVLLLAGDIVTVDALNRNHIRLDWNTFVRNELVKYSKVYMIMGNHEHYGGDITKTAHLLSAEMDGVCNFMLLGNSIIDLAPKWKLCASTFWTDYNNNNTVVKEACDQYMNDHRYIKMHGRSFSPDDAYVMNQQARKFVGDSTVDGDNWIVMTHHTPSMKSGHPKWGKMPANYGFHNTGLDKFIKQSPQIKYWVHGHTHDTMNYKIGETRIICNPKGYRNENPNFDANLQIEI